jgi:cytochrome c
LAALFAVFVAGAAWGQPADGNAAKGHDVFEDRCSECHEPHVEGQGPSLIGVVGRRAGSVPGYGYSDALKRSGLTWTAANLGRFLTGPGTMVPGTAMTAVVPNPTERRDLIAYLGTLK